MRLKAIKLVLPYAVLLASLHVNAADFSYTGNFSHDNDVQTFSFIVAIPSVVTLRTWSYAGGINAAGNTIDRGGFDPILALFETSNGLKIGENDDGDSLVTADINGRNFDTFLTKSLDPGNYTVSIQQYDNIAIGPFLSNGFTADGIANVNFRNGFVDFDGGQRDAHWAFDLLNVNSAVNTSPVPEPETYALMLVGLSFIGFTIRRRKML